MSKALFGNKLAPITYGMGFLQCDFNTACNQYEIWTSELKRKLEKKSLITGPYEIFKSLEPISCPPIRYSMISTKSPWTACSDNMIMAPDIISTISYLGHVIKCRGLKVSCIPHTVSKKWDKGMLGSVKFQLFNPNLPLAINTERAVQAMHDGGRWVFYQSGSPLPFEETERYTAKRIRDRFTCDMLERYCQALGIDLFNPDFYGPEAALYINRDPWVTDDPPRQMTLKEAHEYYGIVPDE